MSRLLGLFIAAAFAMPLPIIFAPATFAPAIFSPAYASNVPAAEDGKRKINLSGRQRMLSQRMAKAACFASIDVQTDTHLQQVSDAHALFDRTLHGLRDGDTEQGMNPEKAPRILEELAGVEELWITYGASVASAANSAEAAQAALPQIAELNLPVLRQMNKTVGEFERHYGGAGDIHPVLALALNISGRQRMLSQKASKEFCLILAGRDVASNREALAETVALFETSLNGLKDGNEEMGLPPAPTDEIYAQLQRVSDLWGPLKTIFDATVAGATPNAGDIEQVARDNNPLLKEMNEAVWMYDQL
ncbi:MAG: type IV pili methyl-accepting chemotaxis transducer N-terminal domain-containing protein [Pseudomonadota bacterium]